ncbi:MAG: glycosyltransferase family 2 protein [Proteobacteria bacterium]|nr:glycosyltransferase family 2 protein [Pseudomonadota bacterium]
MIENPHKNAENGTISIVLPVFNEEETLPILHEKITEAMEPLSYEYEVIYVDDGSNDESASVIKGLAEKDGRVKGVLLRRNFGQSAATAAGIDHTTGDIVVMMDSDLQNDPADIPKLIERIENGADIVSGWRKHRKDNVLLRNVPSWVANRLIRKVSGLKIHDLGCSLKAYRREIIKEVKLYGETHRFIAIYANMIGGKVDEVVVTHHPRQFGESKYGLDRIVKVLLDLVMLKYMLRYATRPIYFFGKLSLFFGLLGLGSFSGLIIHKFVFGTSFVRSPFLLLSSMIILVAFQVLITGIIAELLMRIYHESQKKPVYYIKEVLGTPQRKLSTPPPFPHAAKRMSNMPSPPRPSSTGSG